MERILFTILVLGLLTPVFGQSTKNETKLSSLTKLDLGVQGFGLSHERRISNYITVDLSAGAGGGYDIAEGSINYRYELFKPAFYFSVTPKYFYNRQKRIDKGKSTLLNSNPNLIQVLQKTFTKNLKEI